MGCVFVLTTVYTNGKIKKETGKGGDLLQKAEDIGVRIVSWDVFKEIKL